MGPFAVKANVRGLPRADIDFPVVVEGALHLDSAEFQPLEFGQTVIHQNILIDKLK